MAEGKPFLPETETAVPIICQPSEGKVVGVLGGRMTFKVLSEQTGGAYAIVEQQIPAGQGPPLHVHRHETEIFDILRRAVRGDHRRPEDGDVGGRDGRGTAGHPPYLPQRRAGRRAIPADLHPGMICLLLHRGARRARQRSRGHQGTFRQIRGRDLGMRAGPNQSLHLAGAASRFFRLQSLSSGAGR
jgi:hypothetical protein